MNTIKTLFSSIALGALAMTATVSAQYTDAIPGFAQLAVEELTAQGVFNGNSDGTFAAATDLNRAEVAKVIVLATGVELDADATSAFPDVLEGAWYYSYVNTMAAKGWINGYPDGEFKASNNINRAEFAKMVVNAFGIDTDTSNAPHFSDVPASAWFHDYVETLYNNDVMKGFANGTFLPSSNVTRGETAVVLYEAQKVVASANTTSEGTLEVELSNQTPAGANIPYNATSVPFTTVEFSAADDADIEISSITLNRLGLGNNEDLDKVWLEIDGFKVGNDKSINNDDMAELTFNPAIIVPAGQTLVADVVASVKPEVNNSGDVENLGHINRLAIVSAEDITSTAANISGDFPIEGEEMEITNYEVSELEFTHSGVASDIEVGDQFTEIGKFKLENDSDENRDIEIRAITLKNTGSAEIAESLENAVLYVSGTQVSAGNAIIDGDYITFRLDNGTTGGYVLTDGLTKTFSVRADIVAAEKNDTIQFKIDNYEDVVAIEATTAFGVRTVSKERYVAATTNPVVSENWVTNAKKDAEDAYATLATYTIESGDLNVSRDPASLGSKEYSQGTTSVTLLTSRIIAAQPMTTDGVKLTFDITAKNESTTTALTHENAVSQSFENFKLYINDSLIDSVNNITATSTGSIAAGATDTSITGEITFDSSFELSGTSVLKLVASIDSSAINTDKLVAKLDANDFDSVEYISNGDVVSDSELSGSATGSAVTVLTSELIVTRTDSFSDDNVVAGASNIELVKFNLNNNEAGDVQVSGITLTTLGAGNVVSEFDEIQVGLFVDGVQVANTKDLTASGSNGIANFNDVSVTIPSNGYKQFVVVMASDNSVFSAGATDTLKVVEVAVEATNKENGKNVVIDNNTGTITNPTNSVVISGAVYTFVDSGKLIAEAVTDGLESAAVKGGSNGVEVFKVELKSLYDTVAVKDLYLVNNIGASCANGTDTDEAACVASGSTWTNLTTETFKNLGQFELVAENGDVIQTKPMIAGKIHFTLGDSVNVTETAQVFTVRVNMSNIADQSVTASRLQLAIDTSEQEKGFEALTNATGADLNGTQVTVNSATQDVQYVAYKSLVSFKHAATQPTSLGFTGNEHLYSFVATADGSVELGQVKFNVNISGSDGVDPTAWDVKDADDNSVGTATYATNVLTVVFDDENLTSGSSETYKVYATVAQEGTAVTDNDQVSFGFIKDSAYAGPTNQANAAGNIIWSDKSADNHTAISVDWLNGFELDIDDNAKTTGDN